MSAILGFVVLLGLSVAHAGQERGNGGDAVVCYQPGTKDLPNAENFIVSVELLDLYEGRVFRNLKYDFLQSQNYLEIASQQIEKLKELSPFRYKVFKTNLETFEEESIFLRGVKLKDIDDSAHIVIPKNCGIEQLVIQKEPAFPGDNRYSIDGDLWDKMDAANRSATVTHELYYREISQAQNSQGVRHLNALLNSKNFSTLNSRTWFLHQFFARTPFAELDGLPFLNANANNLIWSPAMGNTFRFNTYIFSKEKIFANGRILGLELNGFDTIEFSASCTLRECKFEKIKAASSNILDANKRFNLNLPSNVLLTEVEFSDIVPTKLVIRSSKPDEPIRISALGVDIETNATSLELMANDAGVFVPQWQMFPDSFDFMRMKVDLKNYPGTSSVHLEDGVLNIVYSDGTKSSIGIVPIEKWSGKHLVAISSQGSISEIQLSSSRRPVSDPVLFSDGVLRQVCDREVIQMDSRFRVLYNPGWKLVKSEYTHIPDCHGFQRR